MKQYLIDLLEQFNFYIERYLVPVLLIILTVIVSIQVLSALLKV